MKFALKDVIPNPFRKIERYKILPEKVEALKESIESTDFWENIVGREVDDKLQIAYGHHRLAALKEIYPPSQEFDWRVKKLSDGTMIQMMARENSETYQTDVSVLLESVRTAVAALAAGQISEKEMPAPKNGTGARSDALRFAPSYIAGRGQPNGEPRPYTGLTLGTFLGMTVKRGSEASGRLSIALNALALEEDGYLTRPERFKTLAELEQAVSEAEEEREIEVRRVAREAAEKKQEDERRKTREEAAKAEKAQREAVAAKTAQDEADRKQKAAKAEAEEAKRKAAKADADKKQAADRKAAEAQDRLEKAQREAKEKEERRKKADEAKREADKAAAKQKAEEERVRAKRREAEEHEAEERKREKEEKARSISLLETAREIITAGRRALAEKRHPDKGGTQEAMAEVNAAKELLDKALKYYEKEEL